MNEIQTIVFTGKPTGGTVVIQAAEYNSGQISISDGPRITKAFLEANGIIARRLFPQRVFTEASSDRWQRLHRKLYRTQRSSYKARRILNAMHTIEQDAVTKANRWHSPPTL